MTVFALYLLQPLSQNLVFRLQSFYRLVDFLQLHSTFKPTLHPLDFTHQISLSLSLKIQDSTDELLLDLMPHDQKKNDLNQITKILTFNELLSLASLKLHVFNLIDILLQLQKVSIVIKLSFNNLIEKVGIHFLQKRRKDLRDSYLLKGIDAIPLSNQQLFLVQPNKQMMTLLVVITHFIIITEFDRKSLADPKRYKIHDYVQAKNQPTVLPSPFLADFINWLYPQFMDRLSIIVNKQIKMFSCCIKGDPQDLQVYNTPPQNSNKKPCTEIIVTSKRSSISSEHARTTKLLTNITEVLREEGSSQYNRQNEQSINETKTSILSKTNKKETQEETFQQRGSSQIWKSQENSKIMYFNSNSESEIILIYKIRTIKLTQVTSIANTGNPTTEANYNSGFTLIIAQKLSNKLAKSLQNRCNGHELIVGITDKEQFQTDCSHLQLLLMRRNSLRLEEIQHIVLYLEQFISYPALQAFVFTVIEDYSLNQFLKLHFRLPNWISLTQISTFLTKILKKSARQMKCNSISKHLSFNLIRLQCEECSYLQLSSASLHKTQKQQSHEVFENKILLAMNLLGTPLTYNNLELYYKLMDSVISDSTLIEYSDMACALLSDKRTFLSKLRDLHIFNEEELFLIDRNQHFQMGQFSQMITYTTLSQEVLKIAQEIYQQFDSSPTLKQSFRRIIEWDDELCFQQIDSTPLVRQNSQELDRIPMQDTPFKQIQMQSSFDPTQILNYNC